MTSVLGIHLPDTWSSAPLKHVTELVNRGSAPEYVDVGPVRVVSQAANRSSGIDWGRARYHDYGGKPEYLKGFLRPRDILINSTGTGTLGRIGYFHASLDERPCMADGHVTVVRTSAEQLEPRFAYYWLSSIPFSIYLSAALVVGATNQIELNRDRLRDAPVPLPPLEEQRRIADFLDTETSRIDKIADAARRLSNVLLERRSAGVISAISSAGVVERRPSSLPWLTSIPAEWNEVRLGLVAQMGSGHTPSRSRPEWWSDCTIPWITTGEVQQVRSDRAEEIVETREKISKIGLENSAAVLHPKGTVVLCRTASAGYSAVMGTDMATSQDFVAWTCGPKILNFYLLWCLRAMRPDLLGRLAMGSTHKTIYVPDLQALKVPLPSIDEQWRIVRQIREDNGKIDALSDSVARQLTLLAERRQALITAAVTGEFDVTTAGGRNTTQGV